MNLELVSILATFAKYDITYYKLLKNVPGWKQVNAMEVNFPLIRIHYIPSICSVMLRMYSPEEIKENE